MYFCTLPVHIERQERGVGEGGGEVPASLARTLMLLSMRRVDISCRRDVHSVNSVINVDVEYVGGACVLLNVRQTST